MICPASKWALPLISISQVVPVAGSGTAYAPTGVHTKMAYVPGGTFGKMNVPSARTYPRGADWVSRATNAPIGFEPVGSPRYRSAGNVPDGWPCIEIDPAMEAKLGLGVGISFLRSGTCAGGVATGDGPSASGERCTCGSVICRDGEILVQPDKARNPIRAIRNLPRINPHV